MRRRHFTTVALAVGCALAASACNDSLPDEDGTPLPLAPVPGQIAPGDRATLGVDLAEDTTDGEVDDATDLEEMDGLDTEVDTAVNQPPVILDILIDPFPIDPNVRSIASVDFVDEDSTDFRVNWSIDDDRWTLLPQTDGTAELQAPTTAFGTAALLSVRLTDGDNAFDTAERVVSTTLGLPADCAEIPASTPSGIYYIDPDQDGPGEPFEAYCEMGIDGGGWTLVGRSPQGNTPGCDPALGMFQPGGEFVPSRSDNATKTTEIVADVPCPLGDCGKVASLDERLTYNFPTAADTRYVVRFYTYDYLHDCTDGLEMAVELGDTEIATFTGTGLGWTTFDAEFQATSSSTDISVRHVRDDCCGCAGSCTGSCDPNYQDMDLAIAAVYLVELPAVGTGFGWKADTGSVGTPSAPYSLDVEAAGLDFSSVLIAQGTGGLTIGNAYRIDGIPNDFLSTYDESALAVSPQIVVADATCPDPPAMLGQVGYTNAIDAFYVRETPGAGYGLTQSGFALCYDDCRSGLLNGSAGMIFVR